MAAATLKRSAKGMRGTLPPRAELRYYTRQSPFTSPGANAGLFEDVPSDVAGLCKVVQGLVVHYRDSELRSCPIGKGRLREINLRYVDRMLSRLIELDPGSLTRPRPLSHRLIGCCRDFAVLFCAMARHRGIPSRMRVGFATYFRDSPPGFHTDHTIAEVWNSSEQRWKLVDPEQSPRLVRENRLDFDPADVPRTEFLVGGHAWLMCKREGADPESFGVEPNGQPRGLWFVRTRLLLDLAALNREELLLWDSWGATAPDAALSARGDQELDRMADSLSRARVSAITARRYYRDRRWKPPRRVRCFSPVARPYDDRLRSPIAERPPRSRRHG